jgi:hypothetical protein
MQLEIRIDRQSVRSLARFQLVFRPEFRYHVVLAFDSFRGALWFSVVCLEFLAPRFVGESALRIRLRVDCECLGRDAFWQAVVDREKSGSWIEHVFANGIAAG